MPLTCKICFESAQAKQQARVTICGHVFCEDCSSIWFQTQTACPVCRKTINSREELIPVYDQDGGTQEGKGLAGVGVPGLGFGLGFGSGFSGSGRLGKGQTSPGGGAGTDNGALPLDERGAANGTQDENGSGGKGDVTGGKGRNEEEEIQVKFVLERLADRWQQLMIERGKLKVEVARLEKAHGEVVAQVQILQDENAALVRKFHERPSVLYRESGPGLGAGVGLGSLNLGPEEGSRGAETDAQDLHQGRPRINGSDLLNGSVRQASGRGLVGRNGASMGESPEQRLASNGVRLTQAQLLSRGSWPRPPPRIEERLHALSWELEKSFTTHTEPVHGVAVNPKGTLVATASWDHLCRIYDVEAAQEAVVLEGHALGLYAVRWSRSHEDLVGTVSSDQTCRLWNSSTGQCLQVLEGHTDEVNGLSFQEGSQLVATASDDMTGIIWDVDRGFPLTHLQGHQGVVYGTCFQPKGPVVATASFDWTAKLWDPRTGGNVQTLRGHHEDVIGVDMDDSGNLLATGSDDQTCRIWDIRMGQTVAVLREHAGEVKRVTFSPYGSLLATTSGDATVRLFNMATLECAHVLSSHTDHVFDAAWSPTLAFLVTASHDRQWKLWRPAVQRGKWRTAELAPGTGYDQYERR